MTSVEGRPLDDTSLIRDAKAGDVSAYEQLVRLHQPVALRVAYLVMRDHAEAEDAAQDAFVKAYQALDRLAPDRPFRPWILAIVRNEALNRRRRAGRQARLQLRVAGEAVSGDSARSPESLALDADRHRRLLAAVDRLPDRFAEAIGLRFLVGLSEAETATTLGVPVGTIKSRTARALQRLRRDIGTDPWFKEEAS
ncbi:MAG: sigma-70 family RNA polymerase sigma factor [Actinomycetota bacterium]|nr:sigma-70 family RNA polymerase sigma factor [Actinomycetota bacterium]